MVMQSAKRMTARGKTIINLVAFGLFSILAPFVPKQISTEHS